MTGNYSDTDENQYSRRFLDVGQESLEMLMPIQGYGNQPLVSLEQAVEPILSFVPDVKRMTFVAKGKCKKSPANNLSIDESASIILYSMEWEPQEQCLYHVLNKTLRTENRKKLRPWFLYLKLILTALSRLPSSPRVVFRGIRRDLRNDYPEGETVYWWGFSSCTVKASVLQNEDYLGTSGARTMFVIECFSGKYIRQHSYFQDETEILLPPGRQFEVVSCLEQGNDLYVIQLKETEPPFPLLEPTSQDANQISDSGSIDQQYIAKSISNFHKNSINENNGQNKNESFSARRDGNDGSSGRFGSGNNGNPRACYNYNQTGHWIRDCPEPRKENRGRGGFNSGGSRGGFNSGGGVHNVDFVSSANRGGSSMSLTSRNRRNRNEDNQDDNSDRKPTFGSWRGGASNDNDRKNSNRRSSFNNSTSRGGFNNGDGFRGGRGGFISGDRDNRGNGGGDNWQNGNRSGNPSRDFPEGRKPRENGGSSFFGGGDERNNRTSDDIFDQPGRRGNAQPVERYIPPPPPTTEDDIFGEAVSKGKNFGKYHRTQVQCTPNDKVRPIKLYEEANLGTQILSNIRRAHFEEPTPIQRYTIPCIRQQDDIMACAQTGSGKTAAFLLPIISNLLEYHADDLPEKQHPPSPLCLILSPTRELALQTEREATKFAYQTAVVPCSAVGGHDMFTVSDRLREGCHILSATTGRLKDMVEKGRVSLKKVKYFVLDEADRMLDTGFEPDIRQLEDLGLPSKDERFTSMFSATFPEEVQKLAKHFLRKNYMFLAVGTPSGANEGIAQTIEEVPNANKKERLYELLEQNLKTERCLIFVETNRSADYIGALLSQKKLMTTTMHGDRTQRQRSEVVQQFTNGKYPILVATSVAARGLDFSLIGYVVNYDLPNSSDFYIHRIGRTGRAGHLGKSISFFDPDRESDRRLAPDLVLKLTEAGQPIPEFLKQYASSANVDGFGTRNTYIPFGTNTFGTQNHHLASPSGATPSAGAVAASKEWD